MYPFAVLRMGRLLAYDGVMQPFRGWFVKVVPHYTGNGDTTESRGGDNLRGALGDLLSCPICSGTHAASITLLTMTFWPDFGLALVIVTFGIGVAEILNAVIEGYQWHGDNARRQAIEGPAATPIAMLPIERELAAWSAVARVAGNGHDERRTQPWECTANKVYPE